MLVDMMSELISCQERMRDLGVSMISWSMFGVFAKMFSGNVRWGNEEGILPS